MSDAQSDCINLAQAYLRISRRKIFTPRALPLVAADDVQSRQACLVRCCLKLIKGDIAMDELNKETFEEDDENQ